MFKYDVLCVGSATVDHFLTIKEPFSSLRLGDKIIVKDSEYHTGGGAGNSAAALAKMGLKVKTLTKLGNDHHAEFILKELKQLKIKNICKHRSNKSTDFSTLIHSLQEKDRVILVHKGASAELNKADFSKRKLRAHWIYLATLWGKSFSVAEELADYAREKNKKMLFNPSLYLAEKGIPYLKKVLRATTCLVLNKEEAQALLKVKKSSTEMINLLQRLGPKIVIITDGPRKLYAGNGADKYSLNPPDISVVHTAGAGDAFTSGFLAGIIKKKSFADALCLGQANSSSVIQMIGTKSGLLSEKEALMFIKKYKIVARKLQ